MYRFLVFTLLSSFATALCPPTGPVLPPSKIPRDFDLTNLTASLENIAGVNTSLNTTVTSFSVSITSRDATFFEYHHTAQLLNSSGKQHVDKNAVYRVASITKLFTTLAVLLEVPKSLDDPIHKYIPELRGVDAYEDITLRMLGSQLAGVPREGNAFDLFVEYGRKLEELGFPVPAPSDVPTCDAIGGELPPTRGCTRAEFFENLRSNQLVNRPGDRAAYSDQAYMILGFALENITEKPYTQFIKDRIIKPLAMNSTGFDVPTLSQAVIPVGAGSEMIAIDMRNYKPTAGLYASPENLCIFLRSILNNCLLPPAATREWLKPAVFTSSLHSSVGFPWEILRTTRFTPEPRPIDLYTKTGDQPGYAAWVVLLPEYDVGVVINAAGDPASDATRLLLDAMLAALIPALEGLARSQAEATYAGNYVLANGSSEASLMLEVDGGPGLKIANWTTRGKPIFPALALILGVENYTDVDARLYPIGEHNRWRLTLETKNLGDDGGILTESCDTWMAVDNFRYAKLPLDEFIFRFEDGRVVGVDLPAMRVSLAKEGELHVTSHHWLL